MVVVAVVVAVAVAVGVAVGVAVAVAVAVGVAVGVGVGVAVAVAVVVAVVVVVVVVVVVAVVVGMTRPTIGIDPGKSGGLALVAHDGTLIDAGAVPKDASPEEIARRKAVFKPIGDAADRQLKALARENDIPFEGKVYGYRASRGGNATRRPLPPREVLPHMLVAQHSARSRRGERARSSPGCIRVVRADAVRPLRHQPTPATSAGVTRPSGAEAGPTVLPNPRSRRANCDQPPGSVPGTGAEPERSHRRQNVEQSIEDVAKSWGIGLVSIQYWPGGSVEVCVERFGKNPARIDFVLYAGVREHDIADAIRRHMIEMESGE